MGKNRLGNDHLDFAKTLNNLAIIYKAMGENEKSLEHYRESLEVKEKRLGPMHGQVAISLFNISLVHINMNETEQARPILERAVAIAKEAFGESHQQTKRMVKKLSRLTCPPSPSAASAASEMSLP